MQIFTLTTGRSGTMFLASLLKANFPGAFCAHERLSPTGWGLHTPDISHRMQFNTFGGRFRRVADFWEEKALALEEGEEGAVDFYVETNHTLALSGLIENAHFFTSPKIVILERDPVDIVRSMFGRGDLWTGDVAARWVWWLDPTWAKVRVRDVPDLGPASLCVWYVAEVMERAKEYESEYAYEHIPFIRARLEDITKRSGAARLFEDLGLEAPAEIFIPEPVNASPSRVVLPQEAEIRKYFARHRW